MTPRKRRTKKKDKTDWTVAVIFFLAFVVTIADNPSRQESLILTCLLILFSIGFYVYKFGVPRFIKLRLKWPRLRFLSLRLFFPIVQHDTLSISYVDNLENGYDFEDYLVPIYEKLGYHARVTKRSGDYGADLVLTKNGKVTVVQAKKYAGNVGQEPVREAVASKPMYSAHYAIVITNRYFTKHAKDLAAANGVKLVERDELIWMINNAKTNSRTVMLFNRVLALFRLRAE